MTAVSAHPLLLNCRKECSQRRRDSALTSRIHSPENRLRRFVKLWRNAPMSRIVADIQLPLKAQAHDICLLPLGRVFTRCSQPHSVLEEIPLLFAKPSWLIPLAPNSSRIRAISFSRCAVMSRPSTNTPEASSQPRNVVLST